VRPKAWLRPLEWFALGTSVAFSIANALDVIPAPFPTRLVWFVLILSLFSLLLTGVGRAIVMWRHERWRALVLFTIAMSGFVVAFYAADLGFWYRDWKFRGALPAYERLVDRFRAGALPEGVLSLDSLPIELRGCCYRVIGERTRGNWRVEFWVARRFPVHHEGWMYYDGLSVRDATRAGAWYSWYQVAPRWYRVAD